MAFFPITNFTDASKDAFARLRTSSPFTVFDSQKTYTTSSAFWETLTSGTGTASFGTTVHEPFASQIILKVGQGAGDRSLRQTRQYWPYQPGKSQLIIMTGVLSPSGYDNAAVERRIGYFDDYNGIGFMGNGNTISIFKRTYTSQAPVETVIPQSQWNGDKCDGTGPSQFNYSPTAANIFWMDLEWLGVGRVRYGIWGPDGNAILCHQIQNANSNTGVYMGTATLPLRYSITNTGATTANHQMTEICSTIISEGGFDLGRSRSRGYVVTGFGVGISTSAYTNVLSIRSATSFGTSSTIVPRMAMRPQDFEITIALCNATFEVAWEPQNASNSGAGWIAAGQNSPFEVNREGWVSSGGQILSAGLALSGGSVGAGRASAGGGQNGGSIESVFPVTLNLSGNKSTILTIRALAIANAGSANVSMNWLEYW